MHWTDATLTQRGSHFWDALRALRLALERDGYLLCCYGASLNVHPSAMTLQMGAGAWAYRLEVGRPAGQRDLVDIFATGPDIRPATVAEQNAYYTAWLRSLSSRRV